MAIKAMTRVRLDEESAPNAWYCNKTLLAANANGDTYYLPIGVITSLGFDLDGAATGTMWYTFSSISDIKAGTAQFIQWNGSDAINTAMTGWKFVSTAADSTSCSCICKVRIDE